MVPAGRLGVSLLVSFHSSHYSHLLRWRLLGLSAERQAHVGRRVYLSRFLPVYVAGHGGFLSYAFQACRSAHLDSQCHAYRSRSRLGGVNSLHFEEAFGTVCSRSTGAVVPHVRVLAVARSHPSLVQYSSV